MIESEIIQGFRYGRILFEDHRTHLSTACLVLEMVYCMQSVSGSVMIISQYFFDVITWAVVSIYP